MFIVVLDIKALKRLLYDKEELSNPYDLQRLGVLFITLGAVPNR